MKNTFVTALIAIGAQALDNGLGNVPQMGWNTWNKFGCSINEQLIKDSADTLIAVGLADLGYNYVNLDDCWHETERDSMGHLVPDREHFPSGMKTVGDYIHDKGLKFGIYSSAGTLTCAGRAGSLYHEETDAADFASWGVDYLKYDNCFNDSVPAIIRYPTMRDALDKTGRPIFYSLCNWGEEHTWQWAPQTGNSWRTTQDIFDGWASIEFNFRESQKHFEVSGPGGWNDPDMLEIGNGGLTINEEKTHFALWAFAKAPLIIGCDLTTVRQESLEILKNQGIIAINQDPNSTQATCKLGCDSWSTFWRQPQAYVTTLSGGDVAAVIVNWHETKWPEFTFNLADIGIVARPDQLVEVTDIWTGNVVGKFGPKQPMGVHDIPGHGNFAYKFHIIENEHLQ